MIISLMRRAVAGDEEGGPGLASGVSAQEEVSFANIWEERSTKLEFIVLVDSPTAPLAQCR